MASITGRKIVKVFGKGVVCNTTATRHRQAEAGTGRDGRSCACVHTTSKLMIRIGCFFDTRVWDTYKRVLSRSRVIA
jgi:hypothetical protein